MIAAIQFKAVSKYKG